MNDSSSPEHPPEQNAPHGAPHDATDEPRPDPSGDGTSDVEASGGEASDVNPSDQGEHDPTATDASAHDASADADATASEPSAVRADTCANCGDALNGPYCASCGQRAADRVVPLWRLANEFLEDLFEFDLRIVHTLPRFLFLPGSLTKEYVAGRRRRYVRPLRLYLFSSFLLFTLLAFTNIEGLQELWQINESIEAAERRAAEAEAAIDSLEQASVLDGTRMQVVRNEMAARGIDSTAMDDVEKALQSALASGRDGVQAGRGSMVGLSTSLPGFAPNTSPTTSTASTGPSLARVLADSLEFNITAGDSTTSAQVEDLLKAKVVQAAENPGAYLRSMLDKAPYLMFALLPAFALLLKLLYLRRGRLYLEHLVFALHVHALTFIAFAVTTVLHEFASGGLVTMGNWIAVSPLVYLVLSMRTVYGQGIVTSSLKALLLLFTYGSLLVTSLIILAVVTFLLL